MGCAGGIGGGGYGDGEMCVQSMGGMGGGGYAEGEMCVQTMGEMGKDFCPNFLQPFLENIDRGSCNDGSREFIPVFHTPHRRSPSAEARTLEYLVGVPSFGPVILILSYHVQSVGLKIWALASIHSTDSKFFE